MPTGDTLTINGPFEAGSYQVFSCAGTGKVVFGSNVAQVYAEWWGAQGNGSADDTAAWNAALASGLGRVRAIPGKNYYISNSLAILSNTEFIATGATFTKSSADITMLTLTGATTATSTTLSANGTLWAASISVTSATGFNPGDYVLIYDNTYAWGSGPTVARNQEINRVLSTSTGVINLGNALIGSYATANTATVVKLAPVHDTIVQGGTYVNPVGNNGDNIELTYCVNIKINDVTCIGPRDNAGVYVLNSAYVDLKRYTIQDGQNLSANGYGVCFDDSHNCSAIDGYTKNIRENSVTNFSRYITIENCTDVNAYDDSFNTHGAGNHHIYYINCKSLNSRAAGFCTGWGSCVGIDTDIYFINDHVINCGGTGFEVGGNPSQIQNRIFIRGGSVNGCAYNATNQAINAAYVNDLEIAGLTINGVTSNANDVMLLAAITKGRILNCLMENFPGGYGITFNTSCNDLEFRGNKFESISSYYLRDTDSTSTNVRVLDNVSDQNSSYIQLAATAIQSGNSWNTPTNITNCTYPRIKRSN